MTKYYQDIIKQPEQLRRSLAFSFGDGWNELLAGAALLKSSRHVYISGIGASWCAGLAIQTAFLEQGITAILADASELLHHGKIPPDATVLLLSRSGKSIEIVGLIARCRETKAKIIAITNDSSSALALDSDICLLTSVDFDHGISVNTYSSIILTGQLLAITVSDSFFALSLHQKLNDYFFEAASKIDRWNQLIGSSGWLNLSDYYYFLARGVSLSSAHESMLLWHEVVKQPATALSTGFFRHGPQEIINNAISMAIWIQDDRTRDNDLRLANDLYEKGINILILGSHPGDDFPGVHIKLPEILSPFQSIIDIMPIQLAAGLLAQKKGVDPDQFLYCNFIVEQEGGL